MSQRGTEIHVLAGVVHHVRTPQKAHPVLRAVIPVENKVDRDEGQEPTPRPSGHLKHPKLIEPKVQPNQRTTDGKAHRDINTQLRHRAGKIFEGVNVVPAQAGHGGLSHHEQRKYGQCHHHQIHRGSVTKTASFVIAGSGRDILFFKTLPCTAVLVGLGAFHLQRVQAPRA